MDASMLSQVLSSVRLNERSEYLYELCMKHKSWQNLNEQMLKKVACALGRATVNWSESSKGVLKIKLLHTLMDHPCWVALQSRDLVEICDSGESFSVSSGSYEFIFELSKHPRWKDSSLHELISLMDPHLRLERRIYQLLMEHPNWEHVSKREMAELAEMAANTDLLWMLQRIAIHSTWKDFTEDDLFDVVEWSYWCSEFPGIIKVLSTHDKWKNVQQGVDGFLKRENAVF